MIESTKQAPRGADSAQLARVVCLLNFVVGVLPARVWQGLRIQHLVSRAVGLLCALAQGYPRVGISVVLREPRGARSVSLGLHWFAAREASVQDLVLAKKFLTPSRVEALQGGRRRLRFSGQRFCDPLVHPERPYSGPPCRDDQRQGAKTTFFRRDLRDVGSWCTFLGRFSQVHC